MVEAVEKMVLCLDVRDTLHCKETQTVWNLFWATVARIHVGLLRTAAVSRPPHSFEA